MREVDDGRRESQRESGGELTSMDWWELWMEFVWSTLTYMTCLSGKLRRLIAWLRSLGVPKRQLTALVCTD